MSELTDAFGGKAKRSAAAAKHRWVCPPLARGYAVVLGRGASATTAPHHPGTHPSADGLPRLRYRVDEDTLATVNTTTRATMEATVGKQTPVAAGETGDSARPLPPFDKETDDVASIYPLEVRRLRRRAVMCHPSPLTPHGVSRKCCQQCWLPAEVLAPTLTCPSYSKP